MNIFKKRRAEQETEKASSNEAIIAHADVTDGKEQGRLSAGDSYQFLVRPIASEKAHMLARNGKYIFRVATSANKSEVAKAVSRVYKVHVESVQMLRVPSKSRRTGRFVGQTSPWKKAIVTLRKGESISGLVETT
jgi:large subunit ribosomal protein L23